MIPWLGQEKEKVRVLTLIPTIGKFELKDWITPDKKGGLSRFLQTYKQKEEATGPKEVNAYVLFPFV